jgi:hypothetical protein
MTTKRTPGQTLVDALDQQLPDNMEWTASENATLDLIEHAADRLAVLRRRFDAQARDTEFSESRLASLQTAIHQIEGDIFRWTKSLNLGVSQAKSVRHQHAAYVRWHGATA